MSAPAIISELIERFDRGSAQYKSSGYKEAELRQEFINPFWETLGWDMTNRNGLAEAYKEVIHEDSLLIGGQLKAPDYVFRVGRERKFFLEAKAPKVDLKMDIAPAYQLKRYAWSAGLPVSILSDFEEFAVYQCTSVPKATDLASKDRIEYIRYTEYLDKWDFINSTLSRDAIWQGAFDKFAAAQKGKRGTTAFDKQFLADMLQWRIALAKNIASRNPEISERELNFAVQVTLDRIIMLRICEDRGIEQYGNLAVDAGLGNVLGGKKEKIVGVYDRLLNRFRSADDRFNSGLFHFSKEKNRPNSDELTPRLKIDDKVLTDLIGQLYYPESPYAFDYVPSDILGHVYEQFLGQVITLTAGHNARIEEKPEVKKAGGVYYTPTYIVDYIVKNTVGKLLDSVPGAPARGSGILPDTQLGNATESDQSASKQSRFKTFKDLQTLTILDPACGSGSFLLGAYQYLLDWYHKYYIENDPKKWVKSKALIELPTKDRDVMDYVLSPQERKRILLTHIHGVDIDSQAVEVAKLNLMLKVLEGSNTSSSKSEFRTVYDASERLLPDLDKNILCGNSLVEFDITQLFPLTAEDEERLKPFNFQQSFKPIMQSGGFDVVLGNPPYGGSLEDIVKEYIKSHYQSYEFKYDNFIYFIERSIALAKQGGLVSFITPELWLRLSNSSRLRQLVLDRTHFRSLKAWGENVFKDAVVNTITFELIKGESGKALLVEFADSKLGERELSLDQIRATEGYIVDYRVSDEAEQILGRMSSMPKLKTLGEAIQGITAYDKYRGQSAEIIKSRAYHADNQKDSTYRKWLAGGDVTSYDVEWSGEWISYGPWLAAPRDPKFFEGPRLLFREIPGRGKRIQCAFAEETFYHGHSITPFLLTTKSLGLLYVLAISNSRLMSWYAQHKLSNFAKDVFPKLNPEDIKSLPVAVPEPSNYGAMQQHDAIVDLSRQLIANKEQIRAQEGKAQQEQLQRKSDYLSTEIDRLVYQLYGLTEEEIGIVEGKL